MVSPSPEKFPPLRTGKAFIATLIGCSLLVAFGMLRQVDLSNEQVIAIAMLCVACVVGALVGERVQHRRRQEARSRARNKKLLKAERAAQNAVASAATAATVAPTGTSFGSQSPNPATGAEKEDSSTSPLKFASLGKGRRANNRKFGRLPLEMLSCNLGEVLDLSAGGMKIISEENTSGPVDIILEDRDGVLALSGAIVWSKRRDAKSWEQGVEFDHLTPEDRRRLTELATNFRKRRTMCA